MIAQHKNSRSRQLRRPNQDSLPQKPQHYSRCLFGKATWAVCHKMTLITKLRSSEMCSRVIWGRKTHLPAYELCNCWAFSASTLWPVIRGAHPDNPLKFPPHTHTHTQSYCHVAKLLQHVTAEKNSLLILLQKAHQMFKYSLFGLMQ